MQPTTLVELNLDRITIDQRCRRCLGDITGLAESIAEVGLLHPIVVTTGHRLVAGQRRLEAHRLLNRTTILCCVVEHLQEAFPLLQAELAENTCHKRFTPSEVVSAAEQLIPLAREAARNRMVQGHAHPSILSTPSTSSTEDPPPWGNLPEGGRAMDQIAAAVDMSRHTLEKAMKVIAAAGEDPERLGDLVTTMDHSGKVNGAYTELLRRQGELPEKPAPCFTLRMDRTGAFKITGIKDKEEVIARLQSLIRELQLELGTRS